MFTKNQILNIAKKQLSLDVLAVAALNGDEIIGMAGASCDCEDITGSTSEIQS